MLPFEGKNVQNKNLHASVEKKNMLTMQDLEEISHMVSSVLEPSDEAPSNILCQKQDAILGYCWFDTGSELHVQKSFPTKE